jgi:nucleoside-diphosphate-sugar epimerase
MRTLITGAGGFVGSELLGLLLSRASAGDELVAADIGFAQDDRRPGVVYHVGGLQEDGVIEHLFERPFDRIVHLATVAGVGSENFDLGKATNLDATMALLEAARRSGARPRFVYSSSVGIFAAPLPAVVDDATLPVPTNSYGTHKLVIELLLTDYTRAGFIDGLALRFPGVIARPQGSTTMLSAFLNDVFYAAAAGQSFLLPLAPDDATWVMSLKLVGRNLAHALELPPADLPPRRYWSLPALHLTMAKLVEALAERFGSRVSELIGFAPNPELQRRFVFPPLLATGAEALGFLGDKTTQAFVENVLSTNTTLAASSTPLKPHASETRQ